MIIEYFLFFYPFVIKLYSICKAFLAKGRNTYLSFKMTFLVPAIAVCSTAPQGSKEYKADWTSETADL